MAYEARIFELYGSDGEIIRAIYCVNDGGRWVYEDFGTPHPNETTFAKSAPRKKNRFTAQDLASLIGAYDFPILDVGVFRRTEFTLLRQKYKAPWDSNIQARSCTLEEADDPAYGYYERGLGWVPFMQTHAESVIADFERAVRLNPAFEPLVRSYLKAARRRLGKKIRDGHWLTAVWSRPAAQRTIGYAGKRQRDFRRIHEGEQEQADVLGGTCLLQELGLPDVSEVREGSRARNGVSLDAFPTSAQCARA